MTSTAARRLPSLSLFCGLVIHGGVSQLALIGGDGRPAVGGGPRANELTPNGRGEERRGQERGGTAAERSEGGSSPVVMRHDGTTTIDHAY